MRDYRVVNGNITGDGDPDVPRTTHKYNGDTVEATFVARKIYTQFPYNVLFFHQLHFTL